MHDLISLQALLYIRHAQLDYRPDIQSCYQLQLRVNLSISS